MKRVNKNSGFTMVELLATITIMGILMVISVVSIQGILQRSRTEYYKSQKENIEMAARTYFDNNKSKLPKVNGQVKEIDLKELQENKLISKVIDKTKKACYTDSSNAKNGTDYSYAKVIKLNDEYIYTTYLVCPDYDEASDTTSNSININITSNGSISNANATINITNNKNISSYNYLVYKGIGTGKILVYDSSYQSASSNNVTKKVDLKKYVPSNITIEVTAIDVEGNSKTKKVELTNFKDTNPPTCQILSGTSTDWAKGSRTVSFKCTDADSGCEKDIYTKKFTADAQTVTDFKVKDLSGVEGTCPPVNLYIDNTPPKLTVKVYRKGTANNKLSNTVANQISTTESNQTLKVTYGAVNNWLNKTNYPNGLYIEVSYEETTSFVKRLEWNENNAGLLSSSSNVNDFNVSKKQLSNPNNKTGSKVFYITDDGYRKGKIEIEDAAGNVSSVIIDMPLDKSSPVCTIENEPTAWTNQDRTINARCSDNGSGCIQDVYSQTFNYTKGDRYTYTVKDKAGNTSTCSTDVKVDKDKPTLEYNLYKLNWDGTYLGPYNNGEWSQNYIGRELYPKDSHSDISKVQYSTDQVNWYDEGYVSYWSLTRQEINDAYFRAIDNAGNISDYVQLTLKIDWEPPTYYTYPYRNTSNICTHDFGKSLQYGYLFIGGNGNRMWAGIITNAYDNLSGVSRLERLAWYDPTVARGCGARSEAEQTHLQVWEGENASGDTNVFQCNPSGTHSAYNHLWGFDYAGNYSDRGISSVSWKDVSTKCTNTID